MFISRVTCYFYTYLRVNEIVVEPRRPYGRNRHFVSMFTWIEFKDLFHYFCASGLLLVYVPCRHCLSHCLIEVYYRLSYHECRILYLYTQYFPVINRRSVFQQVFFADRCCFFSLSWLSSF